MLKSRLPKNVFKIFHFTHVNNNCQLLLTKYPPEKKEENKVFIINPCDLHYVMSFSSMADILSQNYEIVSYVTCQPMQTVSNTKTVSNTL